MLKKILLGVIAVVLVVAGFVATRPADYRVERTVVVAAPPEAVWRLVADFTRWREWSPWEKLDPAMRKEFSGAPGTVGSTYRWAGNDEAGEGSMTLVEATAGSVANFKLEFVKPFASVARTEIRIAPEGAGARVSWSMAGHKNFAAKAFGLLVDFDKLIGKDFEEGLASLKRVAEAAPR